LRKDITILLDQRNPENGSLIEPYLANRYFNLQAWLQLLKIKKLPSFETPIYSLFTFKMRNNTGFDNFDFSDHYITGTLMMRLNDIGFIICLGDNGGQSFYFKNIYNKIKDVQLHPVQLRELFARISYNITRLNFIPQHDVEIEIQGGELKNIKTTPKLKNPRYKVPKYNRNNWKALANILTMSLKDFNHNYSDVIKPPNKILTYIFKPDGSVNVFDEYKDRSFLRMVQQFGLRKE
jgi:hypothetical protein